MEQYKTAEAVYSKQSDLDNFLQQLDFKIYRITEIKDRLELKVDKMYGGGGQGAVKGWPDDGKAIVTPTMDILKYKLNWLEDVIEDISNLTTKIEDFI